MKPAILYAAKSTADKKGSIPAQLKEGRRRAEAAGWTVVGEFKDENKSAYSGNRGDDLVKAKQLGEEMAREHGICGLFIQHSDRLARGDGIQAAHLVEYALWAMQVGVKIESGQDPETFAHDDLIYPVLTGKRNHDDSKRKSEATRDGIERRVRERGLSVGGGTRRYGYEVSELKDGPELLIPFEQELLENRIYRGVVVGKTSLQIARELMADGIKPVKGGKWHGATISTIIRNPFYKGIIVLNGEEYPGIHQPAVTPELWQQANDALSARKIAGTRPRGQGRTPAGKHIFYKGTLKCVCGESMVPRTAKHKKPKKEYVYEHYECYGRQQDKSKCSVAPIKRELIDGPVFRYFERVGLDLEETRDQLAAAQGRRATETRALMVGAEREAQKALDRLERVERDYLDGVIEAEEWKRFRDNLRGELAAAEGQADRLRKQVDAVEDTAGVLADLEETVLGRLAAIRAAIAGELTGAEGAEAARAAILRLFEGFALREPSTGLRVPSELAWIDGGYVLEPTMRESVIPEGVALLGIDNLAGELFGSIPVGAPKEVFPKNKPSGSSRTTPTRCLRSNASSRSAPGPNAARSSTSTPLDRAPSSATRTGGGRHSRSAPG